MNIFHKSIEVRDRIFIRGRDNFINVEDGVFKFYINSGLTNVLSFGETGITTSGTINLNEISTNNITSVIITSTSGIFDDLLFSTLTGTTGNFNDLNVQSLNVTGDSLFYNDVSIIGDLNVLGSITSLVSTELSVGDTLLHLGVSNTLSDLNDLGLYGEYYNGATNIYTGLIRDASNPTKDWFLFDNITNEPDPNLQNVEVGQFTNLRLAKLIAVDDISSGTFISAPEIGTTILGVSNSLTAPNGDIITLNSSLIESIEIGVSTIGVSGNLDVDGNTTLGYTNITTLETTEIGTTTLGVSGDASITGTLDVTGDIGFFTMNGTNISLLGDMNVGDELSTNTLSVSSTSVFNDDVVIYGDLTILNGLDFSTVFTNEVVTQNLDVTGLAIFTNDVIMDTNTLYIDSSNHLVGIGTTEPLYKLDISGDVGITGYIDFNLGTTINSEYKEGRLFYDRNEHALAIYNDVSDVTHQVGQEGLIRVYNNSGSTISNGSVVYISGSNTTENRAIIALAIANSRTTSAVLGVVTHAIENNSFGYVTSWGLVNDIDTSEFTEGDLLYLSDVNLGQFTTSLPQQSNYEVQIGYVIVSGVSGRIYVQLNSLLTNTIGEAEEITVDVIKGTSGTISRGQVVYISGYNDLLSVITVELADSSNSSTMNGFGIMRDNISFSASGKMILSGRLTGINTNAYTEGQDLYVGTTGNLVGIKPTNGSLIQKIATVTKVGVLNGSIQVFGAGRSNDLPGLTTSKIWVGDSDSLPIEYSNLSIDITTNTVSLNGSIGVSDYIDLNNISNPLHNEGRLFYDNTEHSLAIYNDEPDVTHQVGQEGFIRVYNNSGSTIVNGQVVYITGEDGTEGRPTIGLAQANSETTSKAIGLTTHDIENNTYGYITFWGLVNGVVTSAFSPGDILYLSESIAGAVTTTKPTQSNFEVTVGFVVTSAVSGRILVSLNENISATIGESSELTIDVVKGTTGTLTIGKAVYITGFSDTYNVTTVELANASSSSTMPAFGILRDTITETSTGKMILSGRLIGINTSAYIEGAGLYVSTTSGELTDIKPTGDSKIQRVATVTKVGVSDGSIQIIGAGRTNDLPNLTPGKIWVGNSDSLPIEYNDIFINTSTDQIGIGTTNPNYKLDVSGTINTDTGLYINNINIEDVFNIIQVENRKVYSNNFLSLGGSNNIIGDYSGGVTSFSYTNVSSTNTLFVSNIVISINDDGIFNLSEYGSIGNSLLNGINLYYESTGGTVRENIIGTTYNIKSNGDWNNYTSDIVSTELLNGSNSYTITLDFRNNGSYIILRENDTFNVEVNDDFTNLISHTFQINGFLYPNSFL